MKEHDSVSRLGITNESWKQVYQSHKGKNALKKSFGTDFWKEYKVNGKRPSTIQNASENNIKMFKNVVKQHSCKEGGRCELRRQEKNLDDATEN